MQVRSLPSKPQNVFCTPSAPYIHLQQIITIVKTFSYTSIAQLLIETIPIDKKYKQLMRVHGRRNIVGIFVEWCMCGSVDISTNIHSECEVVVVLFIKNLNVLYKSMIQLFLVLILSFNVNCFRQKAVIKYEFGCTYS